MPVPAGNMLAKYPLLGGDRQVLRANVELCGDAARHITPVRKDALPSTLALSKPSARAPGRKSWRFQPPEGDAPGHEHHPSDLSSSLLIPPLFRAKLTAVLPSAILL
ncbi:hypothetical protein IG631_19605 [Alternaria alternata]|nr:hypothetical protein IG631_19605 [Alternaria alternata]